MLLWLWIVAVTHTARSYFDTLRRRLDSTLTRTEIPGSTSTLRGAAASQSLAHVGVMWRLLGSAWRAHVTQTLSYEGGSAGPTDLSKSGGMVGTIEVERVVVPGVALSMALSSRRPLDARSSSYLSAGFRWTPRAPASIPSPPAGRANALSFSWTADALTSSGEVRVFAPGAERVEMEGSFTEWEAIALTPTGTAGWWRAGIVLRSGVHRVRLRVNGKAWGAPPGLPIDAGEFGATAGVIIAP